MKPSLTLNDFPQLRTMYELFFRETAAEFVSESIFEQRFLSKIALEDTRNNTFDVEISIKDGEPMFLQCDGFTVHDTAFKLALLPTVANVMVTKSGYLKFMTSEKRRPTQPEFYCWTQHVTMLDGANFSGSLTDMQGFAINCRGQVV